MANYKTYPDPPQVYDASNPTHQVYRPPVIAPPSAHDASNPTTPTRLPSKPTRKPRSKGYHGAGGAGFMTREG